MKTEYEIWSKKKMKGGPPRLIFLQGGLSLKLARARIPDLKKLYHGEAFRIVRVTRKVVTK